LLEYQIGTKSKSYALHTFCILFAYFLKNNDDDDKGKILKKSKVTCCFAGLPTYSCHKGGLDVQARFRVPEAERQNFSENARCCDTCYRHFRDSQAFFAQGLCGFCKLRGSTGLGWMKYNNDRSSNETILICSRCYNRESEKRRRRDNGVPVRKATGNFLKLSSLKNCFTLSAKVPNLLCLISPRILIAFSLRTLKLMCLSN